jgi:hypothetical protein
MSRRRVTVEQWIAEALQDPDKGSPCTAIALMHVKGAGGEEEIHTKQLSGNTASYKSLADFFVNKATGYSQDLPGIQTFRLLAFYGKSEPQAAFPFTCSEGSLTAGQETAFSKHEPTPTGVLGLLMAHVEKITAMNVQMVQTMAVNSLQKDREMMQERAEMNAIMRDMLLNMKKEDHAMILERAKYERETGERALLARLLPGMVNHLTGRELIPQSHADSELLDGIALRLDPEQVKMLVGLKLISEQEATIFIERIRRVREEQARRQLALREAPPEDANGVQTNGEPKELSS